MSATLTHFSHLRPKHQIPQEQTLEWLAKAHAQKNGDVKELLLKMGLGPDKIAVRGTVMDDCLHENWDEMELFNTGFQKKSEFYDKTVTEVFEKFYPEEASLPPHLIHVTCTGYVAPSGAQKLVASRKAGRSTIVTHAYHMGCYAAIPAIRMAMGFGKSDIVHTELCSIHLNASLHEVEQLVVQTLFADGFIKYSVAKEGKGLKVLALHEEIIEDSAQAMSWVCHDWGLKMTIAKEVPVMIAGALSHFLEDLMQKAGVSSLKDAHFALHPGGPKIITQVARILKLEPFQYAHTAKVLKTMGNMSSATLPHIWEKIIQDPNIPSGTLVVSLAFGPGLSISGGLFQCVR